MKALRCVKYGPPSFLEIQDLPSPVAGDDEVLVSVKACALNFPDTLIIQGLYQFKPEVPFTPGGDFSGIIKEVGQNVKHVKPGDKVLGVVVTGGFAEEAIVPAMQCFPVPVEMDFPTAAAFMMAYGTSYHALKDRANIKEGETLVVLGASGGVGLAAVELGRLMGARVIACASTSEKLELCRKYGADELINYEEEDLKKRIKELTDGKGADVIYDPVGGRFSEPALRACNWGGRHLVIGFAAGYIPKIPLNLPLLKGCQIVGVFWGDFMRRRQPAQGMQNSLELIQLFNAGKIKPHISRKYTLEETPKALEDMIDRKITGKAVVIM
jgi:NADPH2:quinone reductase